MKNRLRKEALARRSSLTPEERQSKSCAIVDRVKALDQYHTAKTVMLYLDFRGEVATSELAETALAEGKRVVVPVCKPDNTITPMEIFNLEQDLGFGTWGIREPKPERSFPVDPLIIDLVLVPGVAFDLKGNRLGYGAGYYDRFIPRLRPEVPLIALAYEIQVIEDIPTDIHDLPMNLVVTEDRVIFCNKQREVSR